MDKPTLGMMPSYWNDILDPDQPWFRSARRRDRRYFSHLGGGRRMRHPFLAPIVYPRPPDRTFNFGYDRLRRVPAVVVKTLDSSAVAKYPEVAEDVQISEVWLAATASTLTELFHQFHAYYREILPQGRYIGWQPRDLTGKNYFVQMLDVKLGNADPYVVEELGTERPYLMREQLTVTFKLVREVTYPAGVVVMIGA